MTPSLHCSGGYSCFARIRNRPAKRDPSVELAQSRGKLLRSKAFGAMTPAAMTRTFVAALRPRRARATRKCRPITSTQRYTPLAMPTNVELKARARNLAKLIETAARLSDSPPVRLDQDDTFFATPAGRLKLRVIDSTDGGGRRGELIFYTRADAPGPRESAYIIASTPEPDPLRDVLAAALGIAGRVRKTRTLYLAGQTRIHIDDVEGLGAFVEIETVLRPGQRSDEAAAITDRVAAALDIREADLVDRAYVDLLRDAAR